MTHKYIGKDMTAIIPRIQDENTAEDIFVMTFATKMILASIFFIGLIIGVTAFGIKTTVKAQRFLDTHYIAEHKIIETIKEKKAFSFKFSYPITVEEKPTEVLSPVERKVASTATMVSANVPDQTLGAYICEKWGVEDCKIAVAVAMAESKFKEDAINKRNTNGSLDVGIFQINEGNWKIPGCSLKEIVDAKKNVDCAYKIWDRADGKEGDGKGAWNPWTVFNKGTFIAYY